MAFRILQLISSAGLYGAETVLLELSSELRSLGHSVTIGVFNNRHHPNLEVFEAAGMHSIKARLFDCRGKIDLKTIKAIRAYVEENSIDIIHSHGYKANIYAVLANYKKRKKIVATCHNWINASPRMSFYTFLDKIILKRFDGIVPVALSVKEKLLKIGIKANQITLIENGIDVARVHLCKNGKDYRKRLMPDYAGKVIGTIGRLTQEKGVFYLLEAASIIFKRGVDCKFLVVGEGNQREFLEKKAISFGIAEKVVFTGKRADIAEILSIMDVFVLPSLTEGQPMSLLEAMASEKAIVATRVGDVPKILKNGELGMIVPPADPEALASGILYYLNHPEIGDEKGRLAYHEVAKNYSSARMAKDYQDVYTKTNC